MRKIHFPLILALVALVGCNEPQWTPLFNGKDLLGWHQLGGDGIFAVEDGCITGTYHLDTGKGHAFLCTDDTYSDFILEFEYKSEGVNSGVQFRASQDGESLDAYHFEIESDPLRGFGGGIHDDKLNWIYPLTFNAPARNAQKYDGWNKGRIEVSGNRIVTFVNGIECADVISDLYDEGSIALQVHQVMDESWDGKKVYFKNIRICTEDVDAHLSETRASVHQLNRVANTLSERQKEEGWKLLFDGKTTEGWRSARGDSFPKEGWSLENGMLRVWENGGAESTHGGDIITVDQYGNFWLSVDFRITEGANSGIKYFVRPDLYDAGSDASAIGCEFQILDDLHHPDAKLGTAGNRTLGSLYDLITSDKSDAWYQAGKWNTAWVKVEGNHVEHWLNGVKVVEYERNTQEFNALVACSKYRNWKNFGNYPKGHILLQEHGNEVFYRNILIKELPLSGHATGKTAEAPADDGKGWKTLFDGTGLDAWRSVSDESFPESGWAVEDGVLVANPEGSQRGGDIITVDRFKDFWLSVDFKLTEGANGGIKYFINPGTYDDPSIGCEFQVLDDTKHHDALLGVAGNRTAGSLYDLIRADKPEGLFHLYDWNTAWVIVRGNHVEHWLNGTRVVEYERNTQEFNALVKYSKFSEREGFGNFESGHILLQDHSDRVYYRNIKIKEL